MRENAGEAVHLRNPQPCADGVCDEPDVAPYVMRTCQENGWPMGHPVLVTAGDGTLCLCECRTCPPWWCQVPQVALYVAVSCKYHNLPPGTPVLVPSQSGDDCYCTCPPAERQDEPDGRHAAPRADPPLPDAAMDAGAGPPVETGHAVPGGDAVRAGSSQPCPDGVCGGAEVRFHVKETCEEHGWTTGHRVLVETAEGSFCYCECPSGSPCPPEFCQRPEIRASVEEYCRATGSAPGKKVLVQGPNGLCYCTCGAAAEVVEEAPDGRHAASPQVRPPLPEAAMDAGADPPRETDREVPGGGHPPCPAEFCGSAEVRAYVDQLCLQQGWPAGHPVLVGGPDGALCWCACGGGDASTDPAAGPAQ